MKESNPLFENNTKLVIYKLVQFSKFFFIREQKTFAY